MSEIRGAYVPLTQTEIERVRVGFQAFSVDAEQAKRLTTICDMATNCLLYAEEIDRLRASPSAEPAAGAVADPNALIRIDDGRNTSAHSAAEWIALSRCNLMAKRDASPPSATAGQSEIEEALIVAKKYAALEPTKWPHNQEPTDLIAHRNIAIRFAQVLLSISQAAPQDRNAIIKSIPMHHIYSLVHDRHSNAVREWAEDLIRALKSAAPREPGAAGKER